MTGSPTRSGNGINNVPSSSFNSSNNQPNSFASAATGAKSTLNSNSTNVKLSSAELLSMLKKPAISTTTNSSRSTGSVGNTATSTSMGNGSSSTEAVKQLSVPIIHSFKEDDYSLQGLINLIKACQSVDRNIFALGLDLENDAGLPLNQDEPLRDTLLSPWFDESSNNDDQDLRDKRKTAHQRHHQRHNNNGHEHNAGLFGLEGSFGVLSGSGNKTPSSSTTAPTSSKTSFLSGRRPSALDSIIPSCYNVPSLPSSITKITSFSDETLFYIFYAMPGDRMQELASRELFARSWRFHKPSKSWISMTDQNVQFKAVLNETANFFIFDQSSWIKVKRSLTLQAGDLEDSRPANSNNSHPSTTTTISSVGSPEMIMHGSGTLKSTSVTH